MGLAVLLSDSTGCGRWLRPVQEGQPEIAGAACGLSSEGKQGFLETWFTVKLQTPLSFSLRPWQTSIALNVEES